MEISKTKFALAIILCCLIAFTSGYAIQNAYINKHQPSRGGANVFLTVESPMGIYDIPITNLITNIGENETATRQRVGDTYVAIKYISLGNATASVSLTKLTTEATTLGAERAEGTVSALWLYGGVDAAYNVTHKFTFTGDITLNCAGGNWDPVGDSDNNLYSCADFTETAFANNWNLTITWVYVFDGN
jgi:hypothetical protein